MNTLIHWKDTLPANWKAMPLKAIAQYKVSSVDKISNDDETPVLLCNYTDVYNNDYINLALDFMEGTASAGEISKFSLELGDVLITKDSESWEDIGIPALVKDTKNNLLCGYHLAIIRADNQVISGDFLFRCIQSKLLRLQLELASTGVTRYGLPKEEIGRMLIPVPELSEQNQIARFLERETSQIYQLIKAKKAFLTLIAEKRQALVLQIVTAGFNNHAPMKDSGVEWIGKVPEHWRVERSKWLFSERNERSKTGEEEMLTVSHLTGVTPRSEKDVNMFEADTNEGYKICHTGDLVINTLWAWMGAMGIAPVTGMVSPAYHVYIPSGEIFPAYIDAIVRLPVIAKEVTRYSKGVWSSRLRLYPEGFYEVYFPVPPLEEQKQIIDFIKKENKRSEDLYNNTKRSIALLEERRSALITAAVTGQITISE
jgi:type I restriction enzyme S subunit